MVLTILFKVGVIGVPIVVSVYFSSVGGYVMFATIFNFGFSGKVYLRVKDLRVLAGTSRRNTVFRVVSMGCGVYTI